MGVRTSSGGVMMNHDTEGTKNMTTAQDRDRKEQGDIEAMVATVKSADRPAGPRSRADEAMMELWNEADAAKKYLTEEQAKECVVRNRGAERLFQATFGPEALIGLHEEWSELEGAWS